MGGSSSGYFPGSIDPKKLRQNLRDEENRALDASFDISVSQMIGELLANFNSRDEAEVKGNLERILAALGKRIEGSIDLLFGGSLSKRTYVEGLSDVDALILLDKTVARKSSPKAVREVFAETLREEMPRVGITEGKLAVTVKVSPEIQLLPAIRDNGHLRISSSDGAEWLTIDPKAFVNKLVSVNRHHGNKVVPTIKIAKSIISGLPGNRQISGYHTESLAVKIFSAYEGPPKTKPMLITFFVRAADEVRTPIPDPTGQSVHVDDRLGAPDSLRRRVVADSLGRIGRRMRNADGAQSLGQWAEILNYGQP